MSEILTSTQEAAHETYASDHLPVSQSLGRKPLFQEIQRRIRSYIYAQGLKPGEMLPPAAEMATYLGVSAASLREGLRAMEALGMLETRHGVGTFVCRYNLAPVFESLSFSLFFDNQGLYKLVQVRKAIEIGLIHDVVATIGEDDLEELMALCQQGIDTGITTALDIEFHRLLYRCLDNELVAQILDIYWMASAKLVDPTAVSKSQRQADYGLHRQIVEALRNRDTEAVVAAMQLHFAQVSARLQAESH